MKNLKKSVSEFNSWSGAARIYYSLINETFETFIYHDTNSFQVDSLNPHYTYYEVLFKDGLYNNPKATMQLLKSKVEKYKEFVSKEIHGYKQEINL